MNCVTGDVNLILCLWYTLKIFNLYLLGLWIIYRHYNHNVGGTSKSNQIIFHLVAYY